MKRTEEKKMKLFSARKKKRELILSTCLFILIFFSFFTSCYSRGGLKVSLCVRALSHHIVMFILCFFFFDALIPLYPLRKTEVNKKKNKISHKTFIFLTFG